MSFNTENVKSEKVLKVAFAGGGTGGHIYPGLAVADELRAVCAEDGKEIQIFWIGNSKGMDKDIVSKNVNESGKKSADFFYGIPSGKLRRYFSFQNFLDIFKIFAGFFVSFFILLKIKPCVLFSKGGFVSVPPCFAAKLLKIPVYTHECDFTPGLATKLNSRSAKKILLSYEQTKDFLGTAARQKSVVTGNPVRPVFYSADAEKGLEFLGIKAKKKPVLLVVGGSLGAKQLNLLVKENLQWLCENFIVVHQTGTGNLEDSSVSSESELIRENYKPYPFIYKEMPDVIACADVVVSRAGANSIWECSVLSKAMVLVPLCGSGTRGDQESNAEFFEKSGAAVVLGKGKANAENLKSALEMFLSESSRKKYAQANGNLSSGVRPARKIAELLYREEIL